VRGIAIISHGLQSSPASTKATALSDIGESLGWQCLRPDYQDLDGSEAHAPLGDVAARIARLEALAREQLAAFPGAPLVLAGSSMGAFVSARVSLALPVRGLFLMAPPTSMRGVAVPLEAARVPTWILHGWHDELIPAEEVVRWAQARGHRLLLVDDAHRLAGHVDASAAEFGRFLQALA
jgi:pimeloyl-ACP methyl ester carboxylesterase